MIPENSRNFHLNCRSVSSNWESFCDLLCDLHQEDKFSFDVVGMSEVYRCERDSRLALPGYHNLITRCRDDDGRGGVGLSIKESINFKVRHDLSVFIPHVFESLFVEINMNSNMKSIVGIIYRPNTQPRADVDIFSSTLFDLMAIINLEKKKCVMMGDLNIDLIKFKLHDKTYEYIENIFAHGYMPMIHRPTRLTHSSATLIDHIYTNDIAHPTSSGIIITDVADHFGVFHIIKNKSTPTNDPDKEIK